MRVTSTHRTVCLGLLASGLLQGCPAPRGGGQGEDGTSPTTFSKSYGGPGIETAHAVRATSDGGMILVGHAGARLNDGGTLGDGDLWLSKLDANGNVEQQQLLGVIAPGSLGVEFAQVRPTPDGGYVAVGTDGGVGINVARFDASGTVLWSRDYASGPWLNYEFASSTRQRAIDFGRDVWPLPDGGFWVVADSYADLRDIQNIGFDGPNTRSDVFVDARSVVVLRLNPSGDLMNLRRLTEDAFGTYRRDDGTVDTSNFDVPIIRATADGGAIIARRKRFRMTPAGGGSSEEHRSTLIQRLFGDGAVRWTRRVDEALYPADLIESRATGDFLFVGNEQVLAERRPWGCAHAIKLTAAGERAWSNDYDCDTAIIGAYEHCNENPTSACVFLLGGSQRNTAGTRGIIKRVFAPDGTDLFDSLVSDPAVLEIVQLSRGEANEPLHALGRGADGGIGTILRLRTDTFASLSSQRIQTTVTSRSVLDETPDSRVMVYSPETQRVTRVSFTGEAETEFLVGAPGSRTDRGLAVVESAPGRFIVAGDSRSFGELAGERDGRRDAWVAAYDAASGRVSWQRQFTGLGDRAAQVNAMAAVGDGSVVLGGRVNRELRALKLSSAGELLWQSPSLSDGRLDDGYTRVLRELHATPDEGFVSLVVKGLTSGLFNSAVVTKLDRAGAVSWQRQYVLQSPGSLQPIDSDADGARDDGFVFAGGGSTSFEIASVVKLDPAGEVLWARGYRSASLVRFDGETLGLPRIRQTPDGGFVVAITEVGVFSTFGEDAQLQPFGQSNVALLKIDASGDPQWLRIYGALHDETLEDLDVLPDGGLLVAARSQSFGEQGAWLLKLGSDGLIGSGGCNAYLGSLSAEMLESRLLDPALELGPTDPVTTPDPQLLLADTAAPLRAVAGADTARQCLGSANPATPIVPAQRFTLTVRQVGSRSGPVTSTPAGIACGTGLGDQFCAADFPAGTRVTLRADIDGFRRWEQACEEGTGGTNETCVVTLNTDRSIQVSFGEVPSTTLFELRVAVQGEGRVTGGELDCRDDSPVAQCAREYPAGTQVTLVAQPDADVSFAGWSGDCQSFGTQANVTVTVDRTLSCFAQFIPVESPPPLPTTATLTVQMQGGSSDTIVQSLPPGIFCTTASGADCSETYSVGTFVQLNPTPFAEVVSWQGCDTLVDVRICQLTLNTDRTVTASFTP